MAEPTRLPLDRRFIRLERVVGYATAAGLSLAGLVVVAAVARWSTLATPGVVAVAVGWLVVTIALAWLAHRWPELEFRHTTYVVGADAMDIQAGVLWRHATLVPRSRVQHTDVTQGPLERRHGLATLVIHTAGTEHARVSLAGLSHETALALRDHLLPRGEADAV